MLQRNGLRLIAEMAVIVATAAVTGFAHLDAWTIVTAVVVVWLGISVFEYTRSHLRVARREAQSHALAGVPADPLPPPEPLERVRVLSVRPSVLGDELRPSVLGDEVRPSVLGNEPVPAPIGADPVPVPAVPVAAESEAEPVVETGVVETVVVETAVVESTVAESTAAESTAAETMVGPESEIEPGVEQVVEGIRVLPARSDRVDEPVAAEPMPHPSTPRPEPTAVPQLELELDLEPRVVREPEPSLPAVPQPELEPAPAALAWPSQATPIDGPAEPEFRPEQVPVAAAAWSWNVWNLERVVRERASTNEELGYLLLYLRDYANPAGMLPPDFDALVRESFGDLLAAPA